MAIETEIVNLPEVVTASEPNLLAVISRAAADPQVDVLKMEALLRLQREIMGDQAKAEFHAAYTRLTDKIPPVKKNGTITLKQGQSVSFAKWEDINAVIQPLLRAEQFGLSFTTRQEGQIIIVVGILIHAQGHSIQAELAVPPDIGPGRNALQAIGSALTYAKRYVAEMLLNIVREGQDDDGAGGEPAATRRGRAPSGWRPSPVNGQNRVLAEQDLQGAHPGGDLTPALASPELISLAREKTRQGSFGFRGFYYGLTDEQRLQLRPIIKSLQADAHMADADIADARQSAEMPA